MSTNLEAIIELQSALNQLRSMEDALNGVPDWMHELHAEHSVQKAEVDALQADVESALADHRAAEAMAADSQEKLQHFQEQIGRVRNQREYAAILQEIDMVKEQIRQAEEDALSALERQETAQQPLDEKREAFRDLDERYATALEKWEQEKPEVAKQAEALRQTISVLEERLPKGILAQFQRILEKHDGQALASVRPVERTGKGQQMWHCGACNYRVRPQAVVEIRNRGAFILCDNCKRILSIDEDSP
jgi:predicted  nucleic acid-binding Zn-ribbon protein